ncbi:MAG: hypothetical protein COU40_01310 [Candidatus Moranbacteria bacterium CG10_big_fil_rev_8_21_14_0_10_35_21]|nr:MAG: hypothetical protein COU40_01310 [Candidatus Moranbacteria bacterium CG10_big_fil_rev_8_21_14_0_10_35_21]PJA88388.1 MAG: hypothetical protein CO139_03345 [Candidatus Moranbacteria bacterium CG_4_9_14_3_um_filter_36_9]
MAQIKEKIGIIILGAILLSAASFLFLITTQKNFKISTNYLIVQNQTGNQDFYTLSKSSEYIGKTFGEVIYSELFINEVMKSSSLEANFLPIKKRERLKEWEKTIKINSNHQVAMFEINVFNHNQADGVAIANGITDVLITKNYLFRGNRQDIDIRVLSGPIAETNPSITEIVAVILASFLFGMIFFSAGLYYFLYHGNKMKIEKDEYVESLQFLEK